MSLTGYLYILQVICTVQVTCLVHIYEPNRLFVHLQVICTVQITCLVHIYEPRRLFVHLPVICTVQITCLVHIYEPNRLFVRFTGYLYSTSHLFRTHL